jgi:hypothetical protein
MDFLKRALFVLGIGIGSTATAVRLAWQGAGFLRAARAVRDVIRAALTYRIEERR